MLVQTWLLAVPEPDLARRIAEVAARDPAAATAAIEVLAQDGRVEVLALPVMIGRDGHPARAALDRGDGSGPWLTVEAVPVDGGDARVQVQVAFDGASDDVRLASSSARLRTCGRRISSLRRSPAGRSTWQERAGTPVTGERPSIRASSRCSAFDATALLAADEAMAVLAVDAPGILALSRAARVEDPITHFQFWDDAGDALLAAHPTHTARARRRAVEQLLGRTRP